MLRYALGTGLTGFHRVAQAAGEEKTHCANTIINFKHHTEPIHNAAQDPTKLFFVSGKEISVEKGIQVAEEFNIQCQQTIAWFRSKVLFGTEVSSQWSAPTLRMDENPTDASFRALSGTLSSMSHLSPNVPRARR